MKGATAVPCVITMSIPKINNIIITGNNQNFFLDNKNLINSKKKCFILKTGSSYHLFFEALGNPDSGSCTSS